MDKAKKLRELIDAPDLLILPGVFDGFSARSVSSADFAAAFVTGSGISESSLGWADLGVMGLEENLRVVRALVGCCDLPLLADADTGYGNAVNVQFAVRGFEQAGVAGLMIEDQVWPKRCGHMKGKQVIPLDEAAAKIRAARDAAKNPNFVIMSRTDTLATDGIDEVIRRLNSYGEAGADLLFADAVTSVDHIKTIVANIKKPLCVNMGFGIRQRSTTPLLSPAQLAELGVAVVIYPRLLTAAALQGMKAAIGALKESIATGNVVDRPDLVMSFEELNTLMGMGQIEEVEQKYLTQDQLRSKYG